jgi:hypothetical protein
MVTPLRTTGRRPSVRPVQAVVPPPRLLDAPSGPTWPLGREALAGLSSTAPALTTEPLANVVKDQPLDCCPCPPCFDREGRLDPPSSEAVALFVAVGLPDVFLSMDLSPAARLTVARFLDAALVLDPFAVALGGFVGRDALRAMRPSTVSVPGPGITVLSSPDPQRTRSIEPVTSVTIPSRAAPLLSVSRMRSPTPTMGGTSRSL